MPEEAEDEEKIQGEKATLIQSAPAPDEELRRGGLMASGTFMRLTILVAVTLQNTSYALVRRYSRGHLGERYSTSSALLVMELVKLVLSAQQIVFGGHPSDVPEGSPLNKFCFLVAHSWKMLVPAVTYLVMNILGFLALQNLDASTFSIVAQMKVFTTAIFSVLILGRKLHMRKWRALTTLVLGVILISNESMPKSPTSISDVAGKERLRTFAIGMAASFGDVVLSGFVSIYFEMVLKSKTETFSVWDRNLQLAFWSILIYVSRSPSPAFSCPLLPSPAASCRLPPSPALSRLLVPSPAFSCPLRLLPPSRALSRPLPPSRALSRRLLPSPAFSCRLPPSPAFSCLRLPSPPACSCVLLPYSQQASRLLLATAPRPPAVTSHLPRLTRHGSGAHRRRSCSMIVLTIRLVAGAWSRCAARAWARSAACSSPSQSSTRTRL